MEEHRVECLFFIKSAVYLFNRKEKSVHRKIFNNVHIWMLHIFECVRISYEPATLSTPIIHQLMD